MTSPTSQTAANPHSLAGTVIGERYRVERLLDEGAMGKVYVGQHIHMRKRVAIKILRPELTRVPEVMARFEREAMAAAHIAHPNVATATDFGKLEDGSVYLVLEYVEGHNLRVEIDRGPMSIRRALNIALQISEALGAAHALDIVHRDLKPENVMLVNRDDDDDLVKVLDFGVAKVPVDIAESRPLEPEQGALTTKAGMVFGTPDYMAPEQALGQTVNGRADLYSLGVILYELLAGKRPFKTDHDFGILGQQLSGQITPIAQRSPGVTVPIAVERLVMELLSNEASKRVQTAPQLSERLTQLLEGAPDSGRVSAERAVSVVDESVHPAGATEPAPPMSRVPQTTPRQRLSLQPGPLTRFKAKLPGPFQRMPDWELWGVAAAVLVVLVAVVALFTSALEDGGQQVHDETPAETRASPPPAQAKPEAETRSQLPDDEPSKLTDAHVEDALKAGPLAVDALLKRFPDDARAHLAAARLAQEKKEWADAVKSAKKALALEAELCDDKHLAALLWRTAQVTSVKDETFDLLTGPMKARGADIIYDLATTKGVRGDIAAAAAKWLDTKGYARHSTPEAAVAAALFRAKSCKIRKALVKRAENVGDRRSIALLEQFVDGRGCGAGEAKPCNGCLANSKEVAAAVAAIAKRHPQQK